MVVLQLLNKILKTSNFDIVLNHNLTKEMFSDYENEFEFIYNHFNKYGKVPDKETFLNEFPEFNILEVAETDKFLIEKLNEEYLYILESSLICK